MRYIICSVDNNVIIQYGVGKRKWIKSLPFKSDPFIVVLTKNSKKSYNNAGDGIWQQSCEKGTGNAE